MTLLTIEQARKLSEGIELDDQGRVVVTVDLEKIKELGPETFANVIIEKIKRLLKEKQ